MRRRKRVGKAYSLVIPPDRAIRRDKVI